MTKTNGKTLAQGVFQGRVLEGLENIKSKQDHHDETIKDLYGKVNKNTNDIATAKGMAKGGMAMGALGVGGGILNFIKGMFGGG